MNSGKEFFMILYINSCPRAESRTNRMAMALLKQLGDYKEVNLYQEKLLSLNEERLNQRTELIEKKDYNSSMFKYAREFAQADTIVISAPFWDLSFPSELKIYLENIYVIGIVSRYGENGIPVGLCKAKQLYFVTTAGGTLVTQFGFDYIKALAQDCFGIPDVKLIKAEMLDILGNDAEAILKEAISNNIKI